MADRRPPQRENAVLLHNPDAVETDRDLMNGGYASGDRFLRGFARYSGVDTFYCQTLDEAHIPDFIQRVQACRGDDADCLNVPVGSLGKSDGIPPTLMMSSPELAMYAWRRRLSAHARSYSICGVTHSVSSQSAMDAIGQLLTTPVQPWDALVCTSNATKAATLRLLDNWSDFLSRRSGGRFKALVQMPVIPLGVESERFAPSAITEEARMSIRRGLGIGDEDIAVLYFGRLSFHTSAHPLAMYIGLEETVKRTGKRVHLLQTGRFANEAVEKEFREAARRYCPQVNAIFLDGQDRAVSDRVWFAADIFTTLSDNIQESFGLAPLEAMAAGLPVVASDWDGYRDTVRNGMEGILVPTWLPLPESGSDLSLQMEGSRKPELRDQTFNHYTGLVSQSTAVDIASAIDAFSALATDPGLRKRMGEAGRKRAQSVYDWRVIINNYQDLWRDLTNIRARSVEASPVVPNRPAHPLRDDPFSLFQGYPTHVVNGDTWVELADAKPGELLTLVKECRSLGMNEFSSSIMLSDEDISLIGRELASSSGCSVIALAEPLAEGVRFRLARTLAWLAKMGLVKLTVSETPAKRSRSTPQPAQTEAQALVNLGLSSRSRGALEAAAEYFEKALKADPDHVDANFQFGELLAAANKLNEAAAYLRRAIAGDDRHLAARRALGKVLFLLGDERSALQVLEDAIERAPQDVETRYLIGAGYRRAGSANNAITHLQAALKIDPKRSDALTHLALARKSLGRSDDARQAIEQALEIDPANVFARAALLSLKIEPTGRKNLTRSATAKRVGIHINRRFHFPLLRPLFEELSQGHWPLITGDGREMIEFDPEVVVLCGHQAKALRSSLPKAQIVQVGHSLASKNITSRVPDLGDYICAPSPEMAKRLIQKTGWKTDKVWVTGYVGNDALFQKKSSPLPVDVPLDKKIVLYAPTIMPTMSSASMLGKDIVSLICGERTDICLLIKPHPDFCEQNPPLLKEWRAVAESHEQVYLLDDPETSLSGAMMASDILVSDASGVIFQYLILDRPIVLVSNPQRAREASVFDADGPEWAWRDVADDTSDASKLVDLIARALKDPDRRADQRKLRRQQMFGDLTSGDAAQRIVQKITELGD